MKTLNNHVILYDAECPLCKVYTSAFVGSGMLDAGGRTAYQQMPAEICPMIDRQRAVNEIALVNKLTGEVSYGISSLCKVISNSFPVFASLFDSRPFIWLMNKAYFFVSYNRRVIALVSHPVEYNIQPSFRLSYRLYYLIFTWLITSSILTAYAPLLRGIVPVGDTYREYLICGGQILFQGLIISLYNGNKRWDYLGNMMTISCAGALLLLPALLASAFVQLPALLYVFYFINVAGLMLLEHIRRTKVLGLGWLLSCTWILYRLFILVFIYKFN